MIEIKKNKKIKMILVSTAFCVTFVFSIFLNSSVNADSNAVGAAGSADDPLVTLSYLNKVFAPQIEQSVLNKIAANTPVQQTQTAASAPAASSETVYQSQPRDDYGNVSTAYILIELTKNQKLRAKSGTLEMILRPNGAAKIISPYQTQGIADITSGTELLNDDNMPTNHSLIIPRSDGRGIAVTSVIAYILVRGDYEIYE